jgi:NitT/TauT family transport system ATP-binding protein
VDAQTRTTLQDELVRIWTSTQKTVLFITHDIAEAILLADRIGVMKAGPGSGLYDVIPVRLPRPRSRADQEFGKLYEQISDLIAAQVAQHGKPGAQ